MRFQVAALLAIALFSGATVFAKEPDKQSVKPSKAVDSKQPSRPQAHVAEHASDKTKDEKQAGKPREKKEEHHHGQKAMMVPPPPPETPTVLPLPDDELMSILNVPVEYMTKEALKKKRQDVAAQIKDAESSLADKETQMDASKTRAKEFVSLYEEGVVSRRELETAQKDADQLDKDFSKGSNKLSEMKKLLARIDKRLGALPTTASQGSKKKNVAKPAPKVHLSAKNTAAKSEEKEPASNK